MLVQLVYGKRFAVVEADDHAIAYYVGEAACGHVRGVFERALRSDFCKDSGTCYPGDMGDAFRQAPLADMRLFWSREARKFGVSWASADKREDMGHSLCWSSTVHYATSEYAERVPRMGGIIIIAPDNAETFGEWNIVYEKIRQRVIATKGKRYDDSNREFILTNEGRFFGNGWDFPLPRGLEDAMKNVASSN